MRDVLLNAGDLPDKLLALACFDLDARAWAQLGANRQINHLCACLSAANALVSQSMPATARPPSLSSIGTDPRLSRSLYAGARYAGLTQPRFSTRPCMARRLARVEGAAAAAAPQA